MTLKVVQWATGNVGRAAVEAMVSHPELDVVVLDVKMPKTSGLELRDRLKEKYPENKFIFLTGHGSEEDYRKGAVDGASYLVKPIQIDQLIAKMNEVLGA